MWSCGVGNAVYGGYQNRKQGEGSNGAATGSGSALTSNTWLSQGE